MTNPKPETDTTIETITTLLSAALDGDDATRIDLALRHALLEPDADRLDGLRLYRDTGVMPAVWHG